MSLEEYIKKRNFNRTPEPRGKSLRKTRGQLFVIQKHAARRLHYDFRLEWDGMLKSWAVPKGPSLDPAEKRLAVHVEDHPVEYASFEGIIPEGEYGGGAVLVWDHGEWEPEGDPQTGYEKGQLRFTLKGEKLQGSWTLTRMKKTAADEKENWLLIKNKDEYANKIDVAAAQPDSVISGKSIQEIKAEPEKVWSSNRGDKTSRPPAGDSTRFKKTKAANSKQTDPAHVPEVIEPQLATLVTRPPGGAEWLHEIKYDGYRILAHLKNGQVRLLTRGNQDWTHKFPKIAEALSKLPLVEGWLDGEVAVLKQNGTTSFQSLQMALSKGDTSKVNYFVFDLLYRNGDCLIDNPLLQRKDALAELLESLPASAPVKYSQHVIGKGDAFFEQACGLAIEGIVSKLTAAPYRSGRSSDWLKVKCLQEQEFIIVGFTKPAGTRFGFGALLLGLYNDNGELIYAGRVGTGFNQDMLQELVRRLKPLVQNKTSLCHLPGGISFKGVTWVKPQLVAQVEFSNWTRDCLLRHSSFKGLREDKPATEVKREIPVSVLKHKEHAGDPGQASGQPQQSKARISSPGGPAKQSIIADIHLSNAEKVLYPTIGLSKLDLARYYEAICDWILPDLCKRPLTVVRCPEGWQHECFFQKHANATVPQAIRRVAVQEQDKKVEYLAVEGIKGLVALVQMGVLEIHSWGARSDRLEYPDRVVFDLDPDEELAWHKVLEAAILVRERLNHLGLVSFVKTTGGKGLHVVAPLSRRDDWQTVKAFAKAVAEDLVKQYPTLFTAKLAKASRRGKIFIDYLRNGRGATAVVNYSTRAKQGAPVAVPLRWEELVGLERNKYHVDSVLERLASLTTDPWDGYSRLKQTLTKRIKQELKL